MICPELKQPANREYINKIVAKLGGKPLEEADVLAREGYISNLKKGEATAYYRAYSLWDTYAGSAPAISSYLDRNAALKAKLLTPSAKSTQNIPENIPRPSVGVKKADTEASRKTRGLSPVQMQAYQLLGRAYPEGREAVESGRVNPSRVALEIADSPRQI